MASHTKNKIRPAAVEIPEGFVGMLRETLGVADTEALLRALDGEPSVSVRVNRRKVNDMDGFLRRFGDYGPKPVPWCASGFYLDRRPDFVHDPMLHAGAYYVQEAASMIYETIVENLSLPERHLNVLDLCAAPGGKTTAILNGLLGKDYTLVANEFDGKRVHILKENVDKWGDPDVVVTNSPTDRFRSLADCFDVVAVDAPCSGEGMMRREPVARSQWSEGLVARCAAMQRDILADAIGCLRPRGVLIYSTCTFNETENEANTRWLTEKYGLETIVGPRHFYPHREQCEGLFTAVFRKRAGDECIDSQPVPNADQLIKMLNKARVRILRAGTETISRKGSVEIPSSRQVLAHDYDRERFPKVSLGMEAAVAYLKGNPLQLDQEVPKGYVAVEYDGYPLGLVKNLGSRANNLYPAEWRIKN